MFIKDKLVVIPADMNKKINDSIDNFLNKMDESVIHYVRNRNVKQDKARLDIIMGKKAEFITAYFLEKEYGYPTCEPDMEIRKGRGKGWICDLIYPDRNIHVKSCSASTLKWCEDYSWTFQFKDNTGAGKDEIFKYGEKDLISLVYMDDPYAYYGTIKGIVPWRDIKDILRDPKKKMLIGLKKCLYYEDLKLSKWVDK